MNRWITALVAVAMSMTVSVAMAQRNPGRQGRPNPAQMFQMADKNHDGKLSPEEFKDFLAAMRARMAARNKANGGNSEGSGQNAGGGQGGAAGKPGMGQFADKLFQKLDTNNDGFLSPDEFAKMREVMQTMRPNGKPGQQKPPADQNQ